MPAVTVVIPLYQTERYVGEALASVLAQTFGDFDVVVVDDGSMDRGPEIARTTGDARVRVVTQANRGLAGARNTGIREAAAPLIAFLDSDDRWHPEKLARHVAHFAGDPDLGVSFSQSRLIDEAGTPLGLIQRPSGRPLTAEEHFCNNPIGNGSAPVLRRAVLDAIAFVDAERGYTCWFDEGFRQSEDMECWVRIATTTNWRFACLDAPLTDYRVNGGGLSADVAKQLASWRAFRSKLAVTQPDLVARVGNRAEAYQCRVLARRAVRNSDAVMARRMMGAALRLHLPMLWEEPARTLVTSGAVLAVSLLSPVTFARLQQQVMGLAAKVPGVRV
jgi:glycosyltransferase involved in cell wall biosynthesis